MRDSAAQLHLLFQVPLQLGGIVHHVNKMRFLASTDTCFFDNHRRAAPGWSGIFFFSIIHKDWSLLTLAVGFEVGDWWQCESRGFITASPLW